VFYVVSAFIYLNQFIRELIEGHWKTWFPKQFPPKMLRGECTPHHVNFSSVDFVPFNLQIDQTQAP
jgi:hypothetical protein